MVVNLNDLYIAQFDENEQKGLISTMKQRITAMLEADYAPGLLALGYLTNSRIHNIPKALDIVICYAVYKDWLPTPAKDSYPLCIFLNPVTGTLTKYDPNHAIKMTILSDRAQPIVISTTSANFISCVMYLQSHPTIHEELSRQANLPELIFWAEFFKTNHFSLADDILQAPELEFIASKDSYTLTPSFQY